MNESRLKRILKNEWEYFLLLLPVVAYFIIFHYIPMYGLVISFKDLRPGLTIFNSPWVGFKWFKEFLNSTYFWRSLKNTVIISGYSLIIGFPLPIMFALSLNEIRNKLFKKITQSVSYFPYFMSTVIVVGMLFNFLGVDNGIVNTIIKNNGGEPINFFTSTQWFRPLYIITHVWQNLGWGAVIYLAALSSIDPTLYEAAKIDGASRIKQIWHISLPGISSTVIVLFLLNLGNLLNVGFEKIILMYNPAIYDVSDVISTFVYRVGIQNQRYSFATAVGFFNQVINFSILVLSNHISRKVSDDGLW